MARLDALNESLIVKSKAEPDAVAGRDHVALVGDQRTQQPADGAAELASVLGCHQAGEPVHAQDAAGKALGEVGCWHLGRFLSIAPGFAGFVLDDGALARQLPLGPNPLLASRGFFLVAVFVELAEPGLRAWGVGSVPALGDAYIFLFCHVA